MEQILTHQVATRILQRVPGSQLDSSQQWHPSLPFVAAVCLMSEALSKRHNVATTARLYSSEAASQLGWGVKAAATD